MPSTDALLKAYGKIPIPDRIDEMTYQEAIEREIEGYSGYSIRQVLLKLYERDCQTLREGRQS